MDDHDEPGKGLAETNGVAGTGRDPTLLLSTCSRDETHEPSHGLGTWHWVSHLRLG